jgi:FXSXX-COOH protein
MDDVPMVTSWLPDVTEMPLDELVERARDDPVLRAAIARVVAQALDQEPVEGCGC